MRSLLIILVSGFGLLHGGLAHARSHHHHTIRSAPHHYRASRHHAAKRVYGWRSTENLDAPCRKARSLGGPCGCFASELIFGHSIPDLWKAWNWAIKFPHTSPAAGTAAVRPHHVVIVEANNGDGTVTVHDSWGVHRQGIRGWTFVNPYGGRFANDNHPFYRREEAGYTNDNHYTEASFYRGRRTASGERWSDGFTAASPYLPFGTRVRIWYHGRSVIVRINDRGPYIRGRGLDLTPRAAGVLGLRARGVGRVSWARL